MTEHLYHCATCGRHNFLRRARHTKTFAGHTDICHGPFLLQSDTPCHTCNARKSRACPDPSVIGNTPWAGCGAWVRSPEPDPTPVRPEGEPAPEPSPEHPAGVPVAGRDFALCTTELDSSSAGELQIAQARPALTVMSSDIASQVDRVNHLHASFQRSANQVVIYAYLAGCELVALKESVKHGQWLAFRESYFPHIANRTAQRYMLFADQIRHALADLPTVGNVKLLENGELPAAEEAKLVAAFHDLAGGKTLTELYRDTGVIRDKIPAAHHPIKPRTIDEQLASEAAKAEQALAGLFLEITLLSGEIDNEYSAIRTHIKRSRWKEVLRALRGLSAKVTPLTKGKA